MNPKSIAVAEARSAFFANRYLAEKGDKQAKSQMKKACKQMRSLRRNMR